MPAVGLEPTIPASARPQTYALDRTATGIGTLSIIWVIFFAFKMLINTAALHLGIGRTLNEGFLSFLHAQRKSR
jgi:TM2 domain-containing membrane protein YozV